jgi:hypothetical protein
MSKETVIATNLNLTGIVKFMNDTYGTKLSGKPFKKEDCQQYCRVGQIPEYISNVEIRRVKGVETVKLYDLIKIE